LVLVVVSVDILLLSHLMRIIHLLRISTIIGLNTNSCLRSLLLVFDAEVLQVLVKAVGEHIGLRTRSCYLVSFLFCVDISGAILRAESSGTASAISSITSLWPSPAVIKQALSPFYLFLLHSQLTLLCLSLLPILVRNLGYHSFMCFFFIVILFL